MDRIELINEIILLDADTYQGIDNPAFLEEMNVEQLTNYLQEMKNNLGESNESVSF